MKFRLQSKFQLSIGRKYGEKKTWATFQIYYKHIR